MNYITLKKEEIIKCTIPSIEDIENLPKEILKSKAWWWLRSPGCNQNSAVTVDYDGGIHKNGSRVYIVAGAVRPLLVTTLDSSTLKLGDTYKILSIDWYYIGEGKFLTKYIQFYSFFDTELDDYKKSALKKKVDEWFSRLEKLNIG